MFTFRFRLFTVKDSRNNDNNKRRDVEEKTIIMTIKSNEISKKTQKWTLVLKKIKC